MQYIKKPWVWAVVIVFLLIVLVIARRGGSSPKLETAPVAMGNVIETVSVTGTVSPVSKADLAFEKGGVISHIYAAIGDHVKAGDPLGKIDDAADAANYQSARATLADLSRGLRPEEAAVQQSAVDSANVTVVNAEKGAINADHDAYAKAQSALVNYADTLFNNAGSINPTLDVPTDSYMTQNRIDSERVGVTQALANWSGDIASATTSDPEAAVGSAQKHLAVIKNFMTDLSAIVSALSAANSNLTQAQINAYTSAANSALTAVNQSVDSIAAAESTLQSANTARAQAQSAYSLKVAGNSSDSIAAQQAKVDQAGALLAEDTIVSPIDGIVTAVAPSVGEFVPAGQTQFSVQSDGAYKIEAFVPEADIAKVQAGDLASTTLDAYGSDVDFESKVVTIDPAETVLEGVPTYKVTLYFVGPDSRIRSGMTANLDILTHVRTDVIAIPYRAVIDESGTKVVRIANAAGTAYSTTTIMTGLKGSDGTIEILSGLEPGQKVVTYVK